MKITQSQLKQIIVEETESALKEKLGGYAGAIEPTPTPEYPPASYGTVSRVRPSIDQIISDVVNQIGKDAFFEAVINALDDAAINKIISRIAKEKNITVGGIKYFESEEKPDEEGDEEYTKLRSVYGQKDSRYGYPLSPSQVVHRSAQTVRGKKK